MNKNLIKLIKNLDKQLAKFGPEIHPDYEINLYMSEDGIQFIVNGPDGLEEWPDSLYESFVTMEDWRNNQDL